jgi:hypothetical protein
MHWRTAQLQSRGVHNSGPNDGGQGTRIPRTGRHRCPVHFQRTISRGDLSLLRTS